MLFTDLVSFTTYCDQHAPEEVVNDLGDLFVAFEECTRLHGLEKIKTIGDAFLATAGLLEPVADPLRAAVSCALAISKAAGQAAGVGRSGPAFTWARLWPGSSAASDTSSIFGETL